MILGTGHLFEEPGALEEVARLARGWFERHLRSRRALYQYAGREVTRQDAACLTLEEFYDRVEARADVTRSRAMERAKTVAAVLQNVLPEGEWRPIMLEMPKEYLELLAGESPGSTASSA